MAAEVSNSGGVNVDVFPWLKSMPVAPEFCPTLAEFEDPIAYIFKIEKEASQYGICKIVPPLPPPSKKTFLANLNKSLLARCNSSDSGGPSFTTRQQQVGFCPRKHRPVQKSVWQSGERYNLFEFEAKAKNFEKGYLKRYAKKVFSALEMETLYWNAMADKPFDVEYANDMPGSAFPKRNSAAVTKNEGSLTVGDTEWNMRVVSRAGFSLLKSMKEEIPGVTSPMVYLAMMFSWFAWHVEDHDLHSLNYLHMGAGKTWYGVPREAAVAFEEVIREHGYGGEINPLVTFSRLGEKTTIMSPEVLLNAGVPCCRLVQNAGEFVITFPRAYHSGFSHGFNCGEASNIATPEWLRIAKEAAVRRASINCPPMVSHFQLLYDLVMSLCSRIPKSIAMEPRSSRLRDKKKGEGEILIKELFCRDMMKNNNMLHVLGKGSHVLLLPENYLNGSIFRKSQAEAQPMRKARLFSDLCTTNDPMVPVESMLDKNHWTKRAKLTTVNGNVPCFYGGYAFASVSHNEDIDCRMNKGSENEQSLFSCVTCGILCFACIAIVQPTEEAARYIMSADCSMLTDLTIAKNGHNINSFLELAPKKILNLCASSQVRTTIDETLSQDFMSGACKGPSSLGLLALEYGNASDSETDEVEADKSVKPDADCTECRDTFDNVDLEVNGSSMQMSDSCTDYRIDRGTQIVEYSHDFDSGRFQTKNSEVAESNSLTDRSRIQVTSGYDTSNSLKVADDTISDGSTQLGNRTKYIPSRSDEDSSRLHVFCLEHALQVESWLSSIGGAHVFLACHPDYPKIESKAKKIAEELEINHLWTETSFSKATKEDDETIRLALNSENALHGNGDWAVKLGINLFYSANLSRSPLYSKQMPYNSVIYSVFGRDSSTETDVYANNNESNSLGRHKRSVVAGKWCGKIWMSTQAHPLLVNKDREAQDHESGPITAFKHERESTAQSERDTRTAITIRTYKRKSVASNRSHAKTVSLESEISDDLSRVSTTLSNMHKHVKSKSFTTKRLKKETPVCVEKLDESGEESQFGNSRKQVRTLSGTKRTKEEISDGGDSSDESAEEFVLEYSWKRSKSKCEAKPTKKKTPEPRKNQKKIEKRINLRLEEEEEDKDGLSMRLRNKTKSLKKSSTISSDAKSAQDKQHKDKAKKAKVIVSDSETIEYPCDIEGCTMGFHTKQELTLHKKNICTVKGCDKKFFCHKYLVQHRRVHVDDRPLKCPWKGCKMTFKWAWARTEHIRVHTGARPYVCTESGCGKTFRFVSDFSRHKRKTGHVSKKKMKKVGKQV